MCKTGISCNIWKFCAIELLVSPEHCLGHDGCLAGGLGSKVKPKACPECEPLSLASSASCHTLSKHTHIVWKYDCLFMHIHQEMNNGGGVAYLQACPLNLQIEVLHICLSTCDSDCVFIERNSGRVRSVQASLSHLGAVSHVGSPWRDLAQDISLSSETQVCLDP